MGTANSSNDEWIELKNNAADSINLDGLILTNLSGKLKINLTGTIPANGFFLLERTDDTTVPNITADQIYKGSLSNSGEALKLSDSAGNLIDEVDASSGWLFGDNTTKQTMERISSGWQTSQDSGGTPRAQNSTGAVVDAPKTTTAATQIPIPVQQSISYPSGIVFSEILPSPEGADETEEWIEIYNQNDFAIDLSGWSVKDTAGKITTYTFPAEIKILAKGFLVLKRPETKIILNNEGDGLNMFLPDGKTIDSVSYEKAPQNQSYNKTSSGWAWSEKLTPSASNIISQSAKTKETITPRPTPVEKQTVLNLSNKKETAAVSAADVPKNWLPFLISIPLAIVSASLIFLLKKFLNP